MATPVPDPSSLGEPQVVARRNRLAHLAEIVFDLMIERYQGGTLRKYDGVESAELIEALRVCAFYTDLIKCSPFDNLFAVEIKGIDGHDYLIQFPMHGPGFNLHTSRVRVTELSMQGLAPGQDGFGSRSFDILEEHSERIKLGGVTPDRAFLVGMSMVIGLMDVRGEDHDDRLTPLIRMITPSNDQLRAMIGTFTAPPGAFDDEEMPY